MKISELDLKKIKIDELQVGMFIVNMGRSWLSHPFLRNQLKITSQKQIDKMRRYGILEVYIDPARGLDVPQGESQKETPDTLSAERLIEETDLLQSEEMAPLDRAEIRLPRDEVQMLRPREMLDLPFGDLAQGGGGFAGGNGIEQKEPTPFPPLPFSVPSEEADHSPGNMEKHESVVFWEQNIEQIEENLLALQDSASPPRLDQVPFSQEIEIARATQQEAQTLVRNIMHDVRMGKSIEGDRVKRVVNNMVDSILRNQDALVSLTRIKKYDEYTFVHSLDVCIFCISLARHSSLSREEMLEMGIGALLHDVGKMKISPQIIKKPDNLNEKEWVEIRKHPIFSLEIMEQSQGLPEQSKQLALQHHERYNGSGYPFGLKGDSIGLFGQIAGIIDFYSAVTTDRYYKKAVQPHEGIKLIYERAQVEFNQMLVERFIQCIGIYPFGTLVLLDTEEMGIVCGVNPETLLRPNVLIIYRNSKTPYSVPFMADLTEKAEQSQDFKRTIIMPLDPQQWNIRVEAYLSDILINLNGKWLKK